MYTEENGKYPTVGGQNPRSISVLLSGDAANLVMKLSQNQNITPEEALRRAIATESHIYGERQQGSKILIVTAEKKVQEILFHQP